MAENFWTEPQLAPYRKSMLRGDTVFRQSTSGTSLFVVLEGAVQLGAESNGTFTATRLLGEGELFGEQAVLTPTPYRRAFTARALTDGTLLEFGRDDLALLAEQHSDLATQLWQRLFRMAARRSSREDAVTRILRISDTKERLVGMVLHFAEANACEVDGVEHVLLSPDSLCPFTDLPRDRIAHFLSELREAGVLTSLGEDYYRTPNGDALRRYLQRTAGQPV